MPSNIEPFTAYLLKKMDEKKPPTLSVGDRVTVKSVKRHQPKRWLGRSGYVAWIDPKPGLSEFKVDLGGGSEGTFLRHQLRATGSG